MKGDDRKALKIKMSNLNITLKLFGGLDKYIKDYNYKKGVSLYLNSNQAVIDITKKGFNDMVDKIEFTIKDITS